MYIFPPCKHLPLLAYLLLALPLCLDLAQILVLAVIKKGQRMVISPP